VQRCALSLCSLWCCSSGAARRAARACCRLARALEPRPRSALIKQRRLAGRRRPQSLARGRPFGLAAGHARTRGSPASGLASPRARGGLSRMARARRARSHVDLPGEGPASKKQGLDLPYEDSAPSQGTLQPSRRQQRVQKTRSRPSLRGQRALAGDSSTFPTRPTRPKNKV
jgi:hypothetical protein